MCSIKTSSNTVREASSHRYKQTTRDAKLTPATTTWCSGRFVQTPLNSPSPAAGTLVVKPWGHNISRQGASMAALKQRLGYPITDDGNGSSRSIS
jgi:hypothetical protein